MNNCMQMRRKNVNYHSVNYVFNNNVIYNVFANAVILLITDWLEKIELQDITGQKLIM